MTQPRTAQTTATPPQRAQIRDQVQAARTRAAGLQRLMPARTWDCVKTRTARFTEEQSAVVERVLTGERNLIVRSTAGSGKSFLLGIIAEIIPRTPRLAGRMGVFAFNGSIAKELKRKLPGDMTIGTFHSFCRKIIAQNLGYEPKLVAFKKHNASRDYLKTLGLNTKANVKGLVILMETLLIHLGTNDAATLAEICVKRDLKFPPELNLVLAVETVSAECLRQYKTDGWVDFMDMMYIVLKMGYGKGCMELMLIDEAQDFSRLQHKIVRHLLAPGGRVIFVGDPDQAIYKFSGADATGLDQAQKFFNAEVLHLTYTFRCPRSHVQLATQFSDNIRAPEDAPEGTVLELTERDLLTELRGSDLVLCRVNNPLIQLALALLTAGKDVNLLGLDLKDKMEGYFKRIFTRPFVAADIEGLLLRAYDDFLIKHEAEGDSGQTLEKAAEQEADLLACCGSIALRAATAAGHQPCTPRALDTLMAELMKGGANAINLCTVHKAKGLEAGRVAILRPESLQLPKGDPEEERAISFVAYTRSKDVLILALGD